MLTKQQIFDIVVSHANKQKVPAMDSDKTCRYRSPGNKLKCFVGALIPDNIYNPEMDEINADVEGLFCDFSDEMLSCGLSNDPATIDFLMLLQGLHDCVEPQKWQTRFIEIAHGHSINMPL